VKERTADPGVWIVERREGYVRYEADDGREWEVHGTCDGRGDCLVGVVLDDGTMVETIEQARALIEAGGLMTAEGQPLDSPVGPGFSGCCPLQVVPLRGFDE
jgi:hypothetical protein